MKMWIARDSDGTLCLFQEKPSNTNDDRIVWWWSNAECLTLNKAEYPEVTFENSPMEVELVIKKQDERK